MTVGETVVGSFSRESRSPVWIGRRRAPRGGRGGGRVMPAAWCRGEHEDEGFGPSRHVGFRVFCGCLRRLASGFCPVSWPFVLRRAENASVSWFSPLLVGRVLEELSCGAPVYPTVVAVQRSDLIGCVGGVTTQESLSESTLMSCEADDKPLVRPQDRCPRFVLLARRVECIRCRSGLG